MNLSVQIVLAAVHHCECCICIQNDGILAGRIYCRCKVFCILNSVSHQLIVFVIQSDAENIFIIVELRIQRCQFVAIFTVIELNIDGMRSRFLLNLGKRGGKNLLALHRCNHTCELIQFSRDITGFVSGDARICSVEHACNIGRYAGPHFHAQAFIWVAGIVVFVGFIQAFCSQCIVESDRFTSGERIRFIARYSLFHQAIVLFSMTVGKGDKQIIVLRCIRNITVKLSVAIRRIELLLQNQIAESSQFHCSGCACVRCGYRILAENIEIFVLNWLFRRIASDHIVIIRWLTCKNDQFIYNRIAIYIYANATVCIR